MKTSFLTLLLFILPVLGYSQTPVEYQYDNAGNRMLRTSLPIVMSPLIDGGNNESQDEEKLLNSDEWGEVNCTIFPNPTNSLLNISVIDAGGTVAEYRIEIQDSQGKVLYSKTENGSVIAHTADVSALSMGNYTVVIYPEGASYKLQSKFVKGK